MSEYSRVHQIYQSLTPKPQDMLSNDRFFVREGNLQYYDNKKNKLKKRYFFLFNDIMLATKKEMNKKYWLRIHITLKSPNVSIENVENNPFQFKLHCKARTFTFQTDSPELKDSWLEDILASISGLHDEKQEKISKDREQLLRNPKISSLEKGESTTKKNKDGDDSDEYFKDDFKDDFKDNLEDNLEDDKVKETKTDPPKSQTNDQSKKRKKNKQKPNPDQNESLLIDLSGPPVQTSTLDPMPFPIIGNTTPNNIPSTNPFIFQSQQNNQGLNNPFLTGNTNQPVYMTYPNDSQPPKNPFSTSPFNTNEGSNNPFLETKKNNIEEVSFFN